MNIFVTGATGFIGKHVVAALLADGHQVTVCGRNLGGLEHPFPGVKFLEGEFAHDHQARDWVPRVMGFDAVINCVGIIRQTRSQRFDALHRAAPIALFEACVQAGVSKVIQLSAYRQHQPSCCPGGLVFHHTYGNRTTPDGLLVSA